MKFLILILLVLQITLVLSETKAQRDAVKVVIGFLKLFTKKNSQFLDANFERIDPDGTRIGRAAFIQFLNRIPDKEAQKLEKKVQDAKQQSDWSSSFGTVDAEFTTGNMLNVRVYDNGVLSAMYLAKPSSLTEEGYTLFRWQRF